MRRRPEMRAGRRRGAAAMVAVLGWVLAVPMSGCGTPGSPRPAVTEPPARQTIEVARQDLVTHDDFAGRLGYADPAPLLSGRDGTLTWMPAEGTVVRRGDRVAEVDGIATRLLIGTRPAWRRLAVGEPDGLDIAQLNDNLAALGFAGSYGLPDRRFDWRTRAAVQRWQHELGLPETGALERGDVVFLPSAARVGRPAVDLGTPVGAGQPLTTVTGTARVVTLDLDVARRARLPEGSSVLVVLPDRSEIDATVGSVGRVASVPAAPGESGGGSGGESDESPTVPVEIELVGSAKAVRRLDAVPVTVRVERVVAEDVLVVPVGALMARSGHDGYAVERVGRSGARMVPVEPGEFVDDLVAISGEVRAGDRVVIP